MTSTAFDEVQQMSVSAFTAAVVLTYETTSASGCSAFHSASCSALMESASEHPASASGMRTVFSGERILADSAMKCTPQNTIVEASTVAARRASARESPTWSAISWIAGTW